MATTLDYIRRIYRSATKLSLAYMKCALHAGKDFVVDAFNLDMHKACDDIENIIYSIFTSMKIFFYWPIYTIQRVRKTHKYTLKIAAHRWEEKESHTQYSSQLYDLVVSKNNYYYNQITSP